MDGKTTGFVNTIATTYTDLDTAVLAHAQYIAEVAWTIGLVIYFVRILTTSAETIFTGKLNYLELLKLLCVFYWQLFGMNGCLTSIKCWA